MQDVFITKIHIGKVRHLTDVEIALSDTERKHLILTGKNGSGKTSLLEAMRDNVVSEQRDRTETELFVEEFVEGYMGNENYNKRFDQTGVQISYYHKVNNINDAIFAYMPAVRGKLNIPDSIEPVRLEGKTLITRNMNKDFLKYMVNLDYMLYSAKTDKSNVLEDNLEQWFNNFLIALREIYDCQKLELKRDAKKLVFKIEMPGREPFGLHEMADGYAAFLDIYMELLMRFENSENEVEYDTPAIVLVDEIETHLHVELQKRILPFLTKMFPNVQFITATHSPFVINSLDKAIIYDLESNERLENAHFYSYDTIVESFLETDMYSNQLKRLFARYKELCFKERTPDENEEFLATKAELEIKSIPSTKLYKAFISLEQQRKAVKNGSSE